VGYFGMWYAVGTGDLVASLPAGPPAESVHGMRGCISEFLASQSSTKVLLPFYNIRRTFCSYLQYKILLGFMGLAQLKNSNKSQENHKSLYKWMAKE
jgi:hypothetical protein